MFVCFFNYILVPSWAYNLWSIGVKNVFFLERNFSFLFSFIYLTAIGWPDIDFVKYKIKMCYLCILFFIYFFVISIYFRDDALKGQKLKGLWYFCLQIFVQCQIRLIEQSTRIKIHQKYKLHNNNIIQKYKLSKMLL